MTHNFTIFILDKLRAQNFMTEEEFENVQYSLEILLSNIFKSIQVYLISFLLGLLFETFIMNLAYVLLRWHANGWHAKSSLNCSIFGIVTFVGIPLIFQKTNFTFPAFWILVLSLIILWCVFRYAPADTEKNPLVSISERRRKKILALITAVSIICVSLFLAGSQISTLLITGLLVEIVMIHPLLYKLNKRSYKNYENYQNQP
ncbi:accessory gene regulator AgrB [Candidatus Enterococcus murrayae]|uniref:Putative AgrB-like protein n=1 Tax=Candidatus Enterococcus murrayae TaxID=2815321 RepID=A0ABS3HL93_9ENTE|nr:accessory gene regulator AgrB [Enterococcus sp. MJM16]MBO0454212.1 accessory gene regulator AgrB [Enterococcus sp. MJM16]